MKERLHANLRVSTTNKLFNSLSHKIYQRQPEMSSLQSSTYLLLSITSYRFIGVLVQLPLIIPIPIIIFIFLQDAYFYKKSVLRLTTGIVKVSIMVTDTGMLHHYASKMRVWLIVIIGTYLLTSCDREDDTNIYVIPEFESNQSEFTNEELLNATYSSYKIPNGFYSENLGDTSLYYVNTVSIDSSNQWIELSTINPNTALDWSE